LFKIYVQTNFSKNYDSNKFFYINIFFSDFFYLFKFFANARHFNRAIISIRNFFDLIDIRNYSISDFSFFIFLNSTNTFKNTKTLAKIYQDEIVFKNFENKELRKKEIEDFTIIENFNNLKKLKEFYSYYNFNSHITYLYLILNFFSQIPFFL
jgi:hypothetical protein